MYLLMWDIPLHYEGPVFYCVYFVIFEKNHQNPVKIQMTHAVQEVLHL